jgi:hypothetical protein
MTWSFDEGYLIDIIIMEIDWLSIDTGVVMDTIRYRGRHGHNQIQGSSWTQSDTGVIMDTIVLTAIFISDCHVKWCWGNNFLTFSGEGKGAICFIFISYYAKLYRKLKINCLDLKDVKKKNINLTLKFSTRNFIKLLYVCREDFYCGIKYR